MHLARLFEIGICPREWLSMFPKGAACLAVLAASISAMGHYFFGEKLFHPEVAVWRYVEFWEGLLKWLLIVVFHWVIWFLVSLGRVQPAWTILKACVVLLFGDLIWFSFHSGLVNLFHKPVPNYWDWWTRWELLVAVVGNAVLAVKCLAVFRMSGNSPSRNLPASRIRATSLMLWLAAAFFGMWAFAVSAANFFLPKLPVNNITLSLAHRFLVEAQWRDDFDYLVSQERGSLNRLSELIEHIELATLQRRHFYTNLPLDLYRRFILSPRIDYQPVLEFHWRREFWENFYPRIRKENDPISAAVLVVRFLRERVGIDSDFNYRVGVQTIWRQGLTDQRGFERIYVASLRAVGIAARLDPDGLTELWTGTEWSAAPRPSITKF